MAEERSHELAEAGSTTQLHLSNKNTVAKRYH